MIFNKIIQTLEEIIYHFIVWIILLPKTFYKVLFSPKWIFSFVESELLKEKDEQFNDYLSPILFWIIVALLPFIIAFSRSKEITVNLLNLGKIEQVHTYFMCFLLSPILIFTVWVQLFKKLRFNRRELQLQIYTLFYVFAPFELFFVILFILPRYNIDTMLLGFLGMIFIICLLIYQFIAMQSILRSRIFKTLLFLLISNSCTVLLIWCLVLIVNKIVY